MTQTTQEPTLEPLLRLAETRLSGYTLGMKTAISIPDEVFKRAERVAKRMKKSRSELYSDALAEYLNKREPSEVTSAIDAVLDAEKQEDASHNFVAESARRLLEGSEW